MGSYCICTILTHKSDLKNTSSIIFTKLTIKQRWESFSVKGPYSQILTFKGPHIGYHRFLPLNSLTFAWFSWKMQALRQPAPQVNFESTPSRTSKNAYLQCGMHLFHHWSSYREVEADSLNWCPRNLKI